MKHSLIRTFVLSLILLGGLPAPQAVRADVIDNILMLIDPELVQARPLIECLANGNPVEQCAAETAQGAVSGQVSEMMATCNTLSLAVEVIRAATRQPQADWIKVLELTGIDLTVKMACKIGIPTGGPVKEFVCGPVFGKIVSLSKNTVSEILVAIRDHQWARLIALTGPSLGCDIIAEVIPGNDPVSGALCSVVGQILGTAAELATDAAGAAWGQIEDWSEDLQGQSQHMSYDEFYRRYLQHLAHKRALQRIMFNRTGLGLDPNEWNSCVKYFDSHKQATDTANKTCTDLGHRLHNESMVFADFAESVPAAYLATELKPSLRDLVAERYWTNEVEEFQDFVFSLPPEKWGLGNIPDSSLFHKNYNLCFAGMAKMLYAGNPYPVFPELKPDSLRDWACHEAAGPAYAKALLTEKLRLMITVKNQLAAAGCQLQQSGTTSKSAVFNCSSFDGYVACKSSFKDYRYEHCRIDKIAADQSLGEKLVAALGSRRCTYLADSKEGYHDPRVVCTREWKHDQCQGLLALQLQDPAIANHPFAQSTVKCSMAMIAPYPQHKATVQEMIDALNGPAAKTADQSSASTSADTESTAQAHSSGSMQASREMTLQPTGSATANAIIAATKPSSGMLVHLSKNTLKFMKTPALSDKIRFTNCATTWDPLAIHCKNPHVLYELADRLPGTGPPPPCTPDPNRDGSDAPCYAGAIPLPPPGQNQQVDQPDQLPNLADSTHGDNASRKQSPELSARPGGASPAGKIALQARPDLSPTAELTVARKTTPWGGMLQLAGNSLTPAGNGECAIVFEYDVKNSGTAMGPAAAQDRWTVSGQGKTAEVRAGVIRIPAGESRRQSVTLSLPPGKHVVTLTIDPDNRIPELNETNNSDSITLLISGSCGEKGRQPLMPIQDSGNRLKMKPVPGQPISKPAVPRAQPAPRIPVPDIH